MLKNVFVTMLLTLSVAGLVCGQNLSKQAKAIVAIEKLGGKVELENNQVIKVDLNKLQITDADLKI